MTSPEPALHHEFWKSAGIALLERDDEGWLSLTPDFLRAYYMRPELRPVEDSCSEELRLHDELMADPFMAVDETRLKLLADEDAAENYAMVLRFRSVLQETGSIEGAYLALIENGSPPIPPLFLDQLVHVILRNCLADVTDPIRLRAAEIFFREQSVSLDDDRLMLADEEIVNMHARAGSAETGQWQLIPEAGAKAEARPAAPAAAAVEALLNQEAKRTVELDVLNEDNAAIYWARSDSFDTVIDFRFEQPALDAFARVIEAWIAHLLKLKVNVQPMINIEDPDWRWHIGLDREASQILNMLYEGNTPTLAEAEQIIGLFEMRVMDSHAVIDKVKGMPIYLALAKTTGGRVKMKPQNLIANLPLVARA